MAAPAPLSSSSSSAWPFGDDLRTSWQDLLLHARLAALRAGLIRTAYTWDDDARQFDISSIGGSSGKGKAARKRVRRVDLQARDGGWPLDGEGDDDMTRTWSVHRYDHGPSDASAADGTSDDIEILTAELLHRRTILHHNENLNFTDLCAVEAKLHAASRRLGKYLEPGTMSQPAPDQTRTRLRCALEPLSCAFSVVLEVKVGSCKARCVELQPHHSCSTEVPPPSASLSAVLDYFGPLGYKLGPMARALDPVPGLKPKRRQKKRAKAESEAAHEMQPDEAQPVEASAEPEEPDRGQRITRSHTAKLAALKKAALLRDKTLELAAEKRRGLQARRKAARAERKKSKQARGGT